MRTIALVAVIGILLIEFTDLLPKSSVGGPLTLMLVVLLAMLAAGIHEAWSNKRGVLGWIVSVLTAVVGGFVGAEVASLIMEMLLSNLQLGGPLAASHHPLRYIGSAGLMLLALAGSWTALAIVNRFR